jgi:MFS family permease
MTSSPAQIIRTYLVLQFGNTLAASLIWGVNTLFLLDAGLSNFEAFLANAFFTLGMVLFEIPTGIIADGWGRRTSYLLGTVTLSCATLLYFLLWQIHGPFWEWALASLLLGLGYTFFSGAVEAWLVDALEAVNFTGKVESVFGKAQIASGIAMLIGTLSGGLIAQFTTLGAPFVVRAAILGVMFVVAWRVMHDIGFTPDHSERPLRAMRHLLNASIDNGLRVAPVRWLMFSSVVLSSVGFYAFYALQPHLLELYGDKKAYVIAGLAATLVATAQICGGLLASRIARIFSRRTTALIATTLAASLLLGALWATDSFALSLGIVFLWGLLFAASMPIRQAYINGMIPSKQRATVLSFDSLIGNIGSIGISPALGRVADISSYGTSFLVGGILQLVALPLLLRSRAHHHQADNIK